MACFKINSILNSPLKCTVYWEYEGESLKFIEPFFVSPGFFSAEDAANFALSVLYPLAAIFGDSIQLPYSISKFSLNFWESKLVLMEGFFKELHQVEVNPVEDFVVAPYKGSTSGLFWGGGFDSCSALTVLLDRGERPSLIRFHRHYNSKDGLTYKYLNEISKLYGLTSVVIKQNFIKASKILVSWGSVGKYINKEHPFFLLNHPYLFFKPGYYNDIAIRQLVQGFLFYFASMGVVVSEKINTLYIGGNSHSLGEPYCLGFNLLDNINYRGVEFKAIISGSRADQFDIVFNKHKELAKYVKSCVYQKKQWCGKCAKCWRASWYKSIFNIEGLPDVSMKNGNITELAIVELYSLLMHSRMMKNRDLKVEFSILSLLFSAFSELQKSKCIDTI